MDNSMINTASGAAPPSMGPIAIANIETLWDVCNDQLDRGSSELLISEYAIKVIGTEGVNIIASRFSARIGGSAHVYVDEALGGTRFLPPPKNVMTELHFQKTGQLEEPQHMDIQNTNTAKKAKALLEKTPRPANSFILFRKHKHGLIKAQNPTITDCEISKLVGQMWKDAAPEVKRHFQNKAFDLRMEHRRLHPNYKYAPRKRSEKKRRVTKDRSAAMEEVDEPNTPVLQSSECTPAFQKGSPTAIAHEFIPEQAGAFLQMNDGHNANALLAGNFDPLPQLYSMMPGEDPVVRAHSSSDAVAPPAELGQVEGSHTLQANSTVMTPVSIDTPQGIGPYGIAVDFFNESMDDRMTRLDLELGMEYYSDTYWPKPWAQTPVYHDHHNDELFNIFINDPTHWAV